MPFPHHPQSRYRSCMVTSATFAPDRTAHCFVCGPENPLGLRLTFNPDGTIAPIRMTKVGPGPVPLPAAQHP